MMIVIKRMNIDELLGNDKQEYTYFKRECPNEESKSETSNNTREDENIIIKPIKTDKIMINGKEYNSESINKALERAMALINAIDKGIITEEEYTTAIDNLVNDLEQERQEQETEDYYQTIVNGLKIWGESVGESMQLILDRMQDMHKELKESEKEEKIEAQKKDMIKTHIKHNTNEYSFKIQKWLKENCQDYVIMISSDHVSIVNRKAENGQ